MEKYLATYENDETKIITVNLTSSQTYVDGFLTAIRASVHLVDSDLLKVEHLKRRNGRK